MKIKPIISDPNATITYAAEELTYYLSLLDPSVGFVSGESCKDDYPFTLTVEADLTSYGLQKAEDPLLDDQYYIDINETQGLILGTNPRSILLGVYAYLRQIGFRFLQPGKQFDYIPNLTKSQELYTQFSQSPSFRHRGICLEGACSLENILDFIEWMPKAGFNSFFVQFQIPYTFLARWYEHENNAYTEPEAFDLEKAYSYSHQIDLQLSQRNLLHHRVGHGWTCEAAGYPSFGWMKTTPHEDTTIFAQLDGKRELFHGVPLNTNLCYSNPEVIKKMTDIIVSYAKNNPTVDYLHVWLADEPNNICECSECTKTTPVDQYIHILNNVDEQLSAIGLSTKIAFLLYQELLWTPTTAKLSNPDRFTLMFAPISRTFMESYPSRISQSPLPDYVRNQITLPATIEENLSFLNQWQKYFKGDSFIYDYPLGRAHYGDLSYLLISQTLHQDIQNLANLGLNGYISCQELRAALPNGFPNYVMGFTLLDQETSFSLLKEDFFRHAYGREYQSVMHYLEQLSVLYHCDYYNGKGPRINPALHSQMEKALVVIQEFRKAFVSPPAASPLENYYWELLDYHSQYSLRLTKALFFLSEGNSGEANRCWDEFKTFICENEAKFQPYADVYRITEVSEKYTGFMPKSK